MARKQTLINTLAYKVQKVTSKAAGDLMQSGKQVEAKEGSMWMNMLKGIFSEKAKTKPVCQLIVILSLDV